MGFGPGVRVRGAVLVNLVLMHLVSQVCSAYLFY